MKDGFAKELVERERHRHADKYHHHRHQRKFQLADEYLGGKESMKARHHTKSFNENLNPLWGWLRGCIGKNWDKCYSELRTKFDARNVINNHILEHLWSEVLVGAYVNEAGEVVYQDTLFKHGGERLVTECGRDYYVCPKDGTLKCTKKQPRRSVVMQKVAEKVRKELAVKRVLDDGNELRKIDGIWYHVEFKVLPKATVVYARPMGIDKFDVGRWNKPMFKTWNELNQRERERFGARVYSVNSVADAVTNMTVRPSTYQAQRYASSKRTANQKLLKAHGLLGDGVPTEEPLTHREASKYR